MENSYNALLVVLDSNQDEELLPPEGYIPAGPITPEGRAYHGLWYPPCIALMEMLVNAAANCGCNPKICMAIDAWFYC